jgi:hypothetical protein
MRTSEIDKILDCAYHKAAEIAAQEIRRHLRPYNLKRHPVGFDFNVGLTVGGQSVYEMIYSRPIHQVLREVNTFAIRLHEGVQARLGEHL